MGAVAQLRIDLSDHLVLAFDIHRQVLGETDIVARQAAETIRRDRRGFSCDLRRLIRVKAAENFPEIRVGDIAVEGLLNPGDIVGILGPS